MKTKAELHQDVLNLNMEVEQLKAQRDELVEALKRISEMTFDRWTNGAIAEQIAKAALSRIEVKI